MCTMRLKVGAFIYYGMFYLKPVAPLPGPCTPACYYWNVPVCASDTS